MTIERRLERLEERAPAPAATGGVLDYLLGVIEAVYEGVDEADQVRRVAALGPLPEPVTAFDNELLTRLSAAYGV